MAYRFEAGEQVEAGFRRIADEQIGKILARFDGDHNGETTIHESRKSLKRLKALLKLVRKGLSKKDYRREYDTVREAGRLLSGARDFEVMPQTLAALRGGAANLDGTAVRHVEAAIGRARRDFETTWDRDAAIEQAIEDLQEARQRIAKLELAGGFDTLAAGASRCLAEFKVQGGEALASEHDEAFHEWRKSAQRHWRHLRLLQGTWPELIVARLRVTRVLADVLGLDHDLAVLAQFVRDMPEARLKCQRRRSLLDAIGRRQNALRQEARAYAGLITADEPDSFAARLKAYRAAQGLIAALGEPVVALQADGAVE